MSTTSVGSIRKPLAERLVQEALVVVAQDGPGALSLREVQRRAGVSPAAAYRHFADRSALMLAVAQECAGLLADRIAEAIAGTPRSDTDPRLARRRLRVACAAYIDFATENPGLYHAIFHSDEQLDELSAPSVRAQGEVGDGGYNLLVTLLTDLAAASGIAKPDAWDPVVVWSALHGLASLRLDAALRTLPEKQFLQARDRMLRTVIAAVPTEGVRQRSE